MVKATIPKELENYLSVQVFMVRHGQTQANREDVFQGQGAGSLNELGRVEVARLSKRLGATTFSMFTSSDLTRAVETAKILQETLKLPVLESASFREVDVGTWQGKSLPEIWRDHRDEYILWKKGHDIRRGGKETYAETAQRFSAELKRLILNFVASKNDKHDALSFQNEPNLLVVSHGGAIRASVAYLLGANIGKLSPIRNTAITILKCILPLNEECSLEKDAWKWELVTYNDAAHLCD